MPASPPPPDRFQREIDDIIRLAEKRLERQSLGSRVRRSTRQFQGNVPRWSFRLPSPEVLAGWALALLLASWLLSLVGRFVPAGGLIGFAMQVVGIVLLVAALVLSLTRGRASGGGKMWRGERVSYGSPYSSGDDFMGRIRRLFGGRR